MASSSAYAQVSDIKRLERRLQALEQKVFNEMKANARAGNIDNLPGTGSPAAASAAMADFEIRLQQLEEENRKIYGRAEELGHAVEKMAQKVELIVSDLDMRLQDLEKAAGIAAQGTTNTNMANQKQASDNKKMQSAGTAPRTTQANVDADMKPEEVYKKAYSMLTAEAYDEARQWFETFIKRFPDHKLADNSYYWLGETHLVQNHPEQAVISFSNGLQAYPEGRKAPANLLKMGVAFKRMGQVDHAKSAWKKLVRDYSDTPEAQKAKKQLESIN